MITQTMQAIRSCMYNYSINLPMGRRLGMFTQTMQATVVLNVALLNQSSYGKGTMYVYSNHADHRSTECTITESIQLWKGD